MNHNTCPNCKKSFAITEDDLAFYTKIGVPHPTFCPECRMQRRMAFRNERALFLRVCDRCQKQVVSQHRANAPFPVYCVDCWWAETFDPMSFGQEFDESRPFLQQLHELQNKVPRPHTANANVVNSDYTNCNGNSRNCYLIFGANNNEECYYSHYINDSKDCVDTLYCIHCESCYECLDIEDCYNISHSFSCLQCSDSMFLFDCRNCSECIGCSGLRNKQYCILNQQYSKEEYEKKKAELKLDTRDGLQKFRSTFMREIFFRQPRKYYHGQKNEKFTGDYVSNCENVQESFYVKKARNMKYTFWSDGGLDTYDFFGWGQVELCNEVTSVGYESYKCFYTHYSWSNISELEYCTMCFSGSSNLFGCVGLRNKQYCILNKQYSKEEYYKLRKKIIAQMDALPYKNKEGHEYRYGEFWPIEFSPFPYQDTVAQEHFPLSKEEIVRRGYIWAQPEKRTYTATKSSDELPLSIQEVGNDVLKEVISCAHGGACQDQCLTVFKITAAELAFYRKKNVPLPMLCHNCRHAARVAMRNPLRLWSRKCECAGDGVTKNMYTNTAQHFHGSSPCPRFFQTAYSEDRKETVYCEACYQAEVA